MNISKAIKYKKQPNRYTQNINMYTIYIIKKLLCIGIRILIFDPIRV